MPSLVGFGLKILKIFAISIHCSRSLSHILTSVEKKSLFHCQIHLLPFNGMKTFHLKPYHTDMTFVVYAVGVHLIVSQQVMHVSATQTCLPFSTRATLDHLCSLHNKLLFKLQGPESISSQFRYGPTCIYVTGQPVSWNTVRCTSLTTFQKQGSD